MCGRRVGGVARLIAGPRTIEDKPAHLLKRETLSEVSLKGWRGVGDLILRTRRLTIGPGGLVPTHYHNDRPSIVYIIKGEIVEQGRHDELLRRFTRRAALGAAAGTVAGMLAIAALPDMSAAGGFLTGLGFQDWGWLWPLLIPPVAGAVGFFATRRAALRMLREVR